MKRKCRSCGNYFLEDGSGRCPYCGAQGTPMKAGDKKGGNGFWGTDAATYVLMPVILLVIVIGALGWHQYQKMKLEQQRIALQEKEEQEYWERKQYAELEQEFEQASQAAASSKSEAERAAREASEWEQAQPAIREQELENHLPEKYTAEFEQWSIEADGMHLTAIAAGRIDTSYISYYLNPGEECIFLDFEAEVFDREAFEENGPNVPVVTVGQQQARELFIPHIDLLKDEGFVLFDTEKLRKQDFAAGQRVYAVPAGTVEFMLRYHGRDGSMHAHRLFA